MDYRTKYLVVDGIYGQWGSLEKGLVVDYQPGNGSRYMLAFQRIDGGDEQLCLALGLRPGFGGYVVSKVNGTSYTIVVSVEPGEFLHWSTVAQYTKQGKADAVVLAEVIGFILNIRGTTTDSARAEDGDRAVPVSTPNPPPASIDF